MTIILSLLTLIFLGRTNPFRIKRGNFLINIWCETLYFLSLQSKMALILGVYLVEMALILGVCLIEMALILGIHALFKEKNRYISC